MAIYRNVCRLMALFNQYQKDTQPNLSVASFAVSQSCYKKYQEIIPHLQVSQLKRSSKVREVYSLISRYPCYRTQKFGTLALAECYSHSEYQPIDVKTVKMMFIYLKRVLAWAENNNFIAEKDICDIIKMPRAEKKLVAETRGQLILPKSKNERIGNINKPVKSWSNILLYKVFDTHIYKCDPRSRIKYTPLHFWLFPIALFHGMRAREIAQLSLDDVIEVNGVYGFTVNDSKPYQRVKNVDSRRFVPIHQQVLNEIGFLDYLAWRKALKHDTDLLFLTPLDRGFMAQNGLQNKVSRMIRDEAEIKARSGYNTHSFRHLFVDVLRAARTPKWHIARVVGHDAKDHHSITDEYGSNQLTINELSSIVNTFTPPIIVDHLRWSNYKKFVGASM